MFAELYFKTTDPTTSYKELLLNSGVYISIVTHVVLYCTAYCIISKCIFKKKVSKEKLTSLSFLLIIIMFFGYIGRLWRAKQLYKIHHSKEKVSQIMNNGYFCWYFIG